MKEKKTDKKNAKQDVINETDTMKDVKDMEDIEGMEDKVTEETENNTVNIEEENEALNKQVNELKDRMLRLQAETDNYRKRLLREKEEAVFFANEKLIIELLDFIDNLDRAIDAGQKGGNIESMTSGIILIKDQLLNSLNKNWGLEKINTENAEFNPAEHEACMAETNPELEKEIVTAELQTGYKLHERVIRPAKVKIAKP